MPNEQTLKTASVLAFERKLDPSDALFFAGRWQERNTSGNWPPVSIQTKSVRGVISNRLVKIGEDSTNIDPAKLDADIEKPNLQTVDVAMLSHQADTLKVVFTLRVLAGTGQPSACNSDAYHQKLTAAIKEYADANKFAELARRYAENLANGRFLWRNRIGAEQIEVRIERLVDGEAEQNWTFDALDFHLLDFSAPDAAQTGVQELSDLIAAGLRGDEHVLLRVAAYARIGEGQEAFPSQELILDCGRGDKSKTLYEVNGVAAIHSQKIGNAIRTIDTWYPNAGAPIAVEPYGSVTTQGKAYRQPGKHVDFYTLLDNWILRDKAPNPDDQHYVVAVLVRGGVFGQKEKD
ncbi:MAG: type I-F CRISPR-associated protein Csy3 [Zoogloeaceae bacterium]|jgi:CRISPR-associated protein Csy3|nr:type I-F CRISPR-associated protein Csy3 [Zoogloeaceae bacterium]